MQMLEERVEPNVSSEGFFHLANQIDRLDAKIDRQNEHLGSKIDRLDNKIDEQGKHLDAKIDRQSEHLVATMTGQGKQLDAKINQIVVGIRWAIGLIITTVIGVAMLYLR